MELERKAGPGLPKAADFCPLIHEWLAKGHYHLQSVRSGQFGFIIAEGEKMRYFCYRKDDAVKVL